MAIKDIEARLAAQYPSLEPTFNPEQPFTKIVMEWVTAMDDRVCDKICAPMDGMQWEQDDPLIPTPPDSTHPNCRCRLQLTELPLSQELNYSEASNLIALASIVVDLI